LSSLPRGRGRDVGTQEDEVVGHRRVYEYGVT
jgi:hypothetical protein